MNEMNLLRTAIERSVSSCVLEYAYRVYQGEWPDDANVLHEMWESEAEDLCDMFPDIEAILELSIIEATWKREMERRKRIIGAVSAVNGPEEFCARVITAASYFMFNGPEREVLDAAFGDGWFDAEPAPGKAKWLLHVRAGLDKFFVKLDAGNSRRFAYNVLQRVKL